MSKLIGILTSGGDTPGLNAALRAIGKTVMGEANYQVIGFMDGFRGLAQNRNIRLNREVLSNIITLGGTILGTSRDKPHKMLVGGKKMDMRDVIVENYEKHQLEALVCIGGGGTHKNAQKLAEKGLNIITLPKTIDNDIEFTDTTIGYDTALGIATSAIDRLHTTAHSHHRIIVVETMGHNVGWLALGAGIAGGADVIIIPEIAYNVEIVAESILARYRNGKRFSIVVVAEGAMSVQERKVLEALIQKKEQAVDEKDVKTAKSDIQAFYESRKDHTINLAHQLESLTNLEARVTILGHLQRGGIPSAADRLLASRLGTSAALEILNKNYGNMIAAKSDQTVPIPISQVAGLKKYVPLGHHWVEAARKLGTCFGDLSLTF
ncbi:MAG: ATP-dependent 6-phosphofructokinase [Candidatus Marinimicrobia bacterium]|nr:ATP-dependent 6-phosphofructokinase [Candidatus Neomarinimicrobiota bacterium]